MLYCLSCRPLTEELQTHVDMETEHSEIYLQNGSDHVVVASYSGLYEECDVEHINVPPRPTLLILAGGHVRASAGALAVHGALIPRARARARVCVCVCVRVCPVSNSFLITPRIGTKFVSVDR